MRWEPDATVNVITDVDCQNTVAQSWYYQRFTRQSHERGETAGWRFASGWHRRDSGLEWAWFTREVEDDDATERE